MYSVLRTFLLLVALPLAGVFQGPPDFLQQAKDIPRGDWTDAQILDWRAQAEDYLRTTAKGDPTREEVYKYLADWEKILDEHDPRRALNVVNAYLAEFSQGELRDEMDWERVKLQEFRYERSSEDVTETLEIARAFEDYLSSHLGSKVVARIRVALGIQYEIAFEILDAFPDNNPGFGATDATEYRTKARRLWREALASQDENASTEARELLAKDRIFLLRSSPSPRSSRPASPRGYGVGRS